MVDSHCEIIWDDNYGVDLGHHPTENYAPGLYDASKQAVISQQFLRYKKIGLSVKNPLVNYENIKLRYFKSAYTFNSKDDRYEMFYAGVKMVQPDTHAGYSDIKYKLENMKMPHLKHDTPKSKIHICGMDE